MDFCICLQSKLRQLVATQGGGSATTSNPANSVSPVGCNTRHSPEGDSVHICPRCHNGAVTAVKETKCLEICCVPLVPLGSSHVWQCGICQWQASQDGPAPPLAQGGYGQQPQQWQQPTYGPQQGMQQQPYAPGGYGGQR